MSLSELAQTRMLSNDTLHRHVHQLAFSGHITIHRRAGKPSVYQLSGWEQKSGRIAGLLQRLRRRQPPTADKDTPTNQMVAGLVGRQEIMATLRENAAKGQHTLLVGPLGIGKSHLLRHLATSLEPGSRGAEEPGSRGAGEPGSANPKSQIRNPKSLYLEHIAPVKPALLDLAERLHQDGHLEVEGIEAGYVEWEDVRKKIAPLRVNQLAALVTAGLKAGPYTLILDHLERVTPTILPHLNALMEVAVVIAATDELKPSAQRLWWAFEQIEVPALSREQARELLWQVADRDRVVQPQLFETRVLQQAGGNPLAIVTMAGKAGSRGPSSPSGQGERAARLSTAEIRDLHHGAGIRYIPLTPLLMLVGALIVAARFIALGLNDRDLYVLAGLGYATFFFVRYFMYRVD